MEEQRESIFLEIITEMEKTKPFFNQINIFKTYYCSYKRIIKANKKTELNNKYKNKLSNNRPFFYQLFVHFMIMINCFALILSNSLTKQIKLHSSIITLKINITGNATIYNSSFPFPPNEVYINGIRIDNPDNEYYFNEFNNTIDLIWDDNLYSCENLFQGCLNITEIDLSKFNTSLVNNTEHMFSGCFSLTSLDLSNINTDKVTTMSYMFSGCFSLTSLDLSNINTDKVTTMSYMFSGCSSLTSLDLSVFIIEYNKFI